MGQVVKVARGRPYDTLGARELKNLGTVGYLNRRQFSHWGVPPHWHDTAGQKEWLGGCRALGKAVWEVL